MQIPDRIDDLVPFAWVDLNDRFGPGPNVVSSLTPENYPVSIFVRIPQPHMLEGEHRWNKLERLRLITWNKLSHIIMGNRPVILCNSTDSVFTCPICRERQKLLFVGKEAEIGGHWGKGIITSVIGQETDHVVVRLYGEGIRTPTNTALARIPLNAFFLNRGDRLRRKLLERRGKIPTSPRNAMILPRLGSEALQPLPQVKQREHRNTGWTASPLFLNQYRHTRTYSS